MKILYVTEQGSIIKKISRRLLIVKEGKTIAEISLIGLDGIVVFGNIQITSPVIASVLENGIYISFLSSKGKFRGILLPNQHKNVFLRISQYERYLDDEFQRTLASKIVNAKIKNAKTVIRKHLSNHPEQVFTQELISIEQIMEKVKKIPPIPVLLGLEGQASAVYFRVFRKMILADMLFSGRSKRPPKDAVNALLSLGYAMLTHEILSLLFATGFDPYVGYLHGIDYGRPALALDMVEEFRHSIIDRLILNLVNTRIITQNDFIEDNEKGFILTKDALKKFIIHYEKRMTDQIEHPRTHEKTSFRNIVREQIYRISRTIMMKQEYIPVYY